MNEFFPSRFDIKCMFSKFCQLFLFFRFSQFFLFHVITKQLLCHLRRPFCVLWVLVFNYFSMTCSVNEANLLEVMFLLLHWRLVTQSARTWHDYPWNYAPRSYMWHGPWHNYCIISAARWRPRRWFRKFTLSFRPIRKEIVSSMYNNKFKTYIPNSAEKQKKKPSKQINKQTLNNKDQNETL